MAPQRVFSAPGKALIAGGYLVLDRQFDSYAVALSARMHAVVEGSPSPENSTTSVTVKSPQFAEGEWTYRLSDSGSYKVEEINGRTNPFAAATVSAVLAYVGDEVSHNNIIITVFSDAGYHSQDNSVLKTSNDTNLAFHYHNDKITDVAKTGLGSSAGLVTVLTTALLSFLVPSIDINTDSGLRIVHNLAQTAHCQAQGKVGSGFDVAAAVFGSVVYRRFDPSLINSLKAVTECTREEYHKQIKDLVESDWDIKSDRVALPRGVKLLMGDVKGGSNTPKLVAKVLAWRQSDPESGSVYNELDASNTKLVECLSKMNVMASEDPEKYDQVLKFVSENTSAEVLKSSYPQLIVFKELINAVETIRKNFRIITERSGAEIEPPQQTELLDECQRIPGVIAGVVPGAGGYDAISLIVTEDSEKIINDETSSKEQFEKVTWMDLREEAFGVREEHIKDYASFL